MNRHDANNPLADDLSAFLDGELDPERRQEVTDALAEDAGLQTLLRELEATRDLVSGLPRRTADSDTLDHVSRRIESERHHETGSSLFRSWRIVAAAATVAIVATLWVLTANRTTQVVQIPIQEETHDQSLNSAAPAEGDAKIADEKADADQNLQDFKPSRENSTLDSRTLGEASESKRISSQSTPSLSPSAAPLAGVASALESGESKRDKIGAASPLTDAKQAKNEKSSKTAQVRVVIDSSHDQSLTAAKKYVLQFCKTHSLTLSSAHRPGDSLMVREISREKLVRLLDELERLEQQRIRLSPSLTHGRDDSTGADLAASESFLSSPDEKRRQKKANNLRRSVNTREPFSTESQPKGRIASPSSKKAKPLSNDKQFAQAKERAPSSGVSKKWSARDAPRSLKRPLTQGKKPTSSDKDEVPRFDVLFEFQKISNSDIGISSDY
jgi:hypothetical protein